MRGGGSRGKPRRRLRPRRSVLLHPPYASVISPSFAFECDKDAPGRLGMPRRPLFENGKEPKMPKLKNKSSAKKRFSVTATGKVRFNSAKLRHMLRRRSQKMKRTNRGTQILKDRDARIVLKNFLRMT